MARVVDIVDGAAAALDGFGHAFVSGEAALVPELEGEADDLVTLGAQESGDGGGVDPSGHGYGDGFGARWAWCAATVCLSCLLMGYQHNRRNQ